MENNEKRVLAYHLATVIEEDELMAISGGGSGKIPCNKTVFPSGRDMKSIDYQFDL